MKLIIEILKMLAVVTLLYAFLAMTGVSKAELTESRAHVLLRWAADVSGYRRTDELPAFEYHPHEELARLYYGERWEALKEGGLTNTIQGVYDHRTNTMHLRDDEDYSRPELEYVLVHEFIHHLQAVNGMEFPCVAASEAMAYRVQGLWVIASGVGTYPDPLMVMFATTCNPHY